MRTLRLSYIHSNIHALDAVFAEAEKEEPVDDVLCLVDIVGHGPSPMACRNRLWARQTVSILGNHDAAVAVLLSIDQFNEMAAAANRWSSQQISNRMEHED